MWLYFPVAVAHNVFGASDPNSPAYKAGVEWGGICFAVYSAVCFGFSFALPILARKLGRKNTHTLCLLCGAVGLISVAVMHNKYMLAAHDARRWRRLGKHAFDAVRHARRFSAVRPDGRLHGHLQFLCGHSGNTDNFSSDGS